MSKVNNVVFDHGDQRNNEFDNELILELMEDILVVQNAYVKVGYHMVSVEQAFEIWSDYSVECFKLRGDQNMPEGAIWEDIPKNLYTIFEVSKHIALRYNYIS